MAEQASISEVLRREQDRLLGLPGVVGVAESECAGAPCLLVLVTAWTPELKAALPDVLGGYPLRVVESGEITPRDET